VNQSQWGNHQNVLEQMLLLILQGGNPIDNATRAIEVNGSGGRKKKKHKASQGVTLLDQFEAGDEDTEKQGHRSRLSRFKSQLVVEQEPCEFLGLERAGCSAALETKQFSMHSAEALSADYLAAIAARVRVEISEGQNSSQQAQSEEEGDRGTSSPRSDSEETQGGKWKNGRIRACPLPSEVLPKHRGDRL
jgi:hypothetical protein